ncbi:hypothetical protein BEWA_015600 [Theileria equi strain WA]|uniref:Uncharacterized protein n=1 Tax=Theileria equi strain WA TaxID=1537102 RepID=L1LCJ3_THEEQ|nr:hypothetical protein BEWA_015600 [Theileria equi strain WA]EKX72999.1 hypothetical protein BEWA_015600 [Theileria equi strain WA]|eukprot:XP_004832451.1 hypothetical protein BEWA_015600 [Theileria equi strain WA]
MSSGIRLDIHKDKWNQTEGIKCETYNIHGGYHSYKYYSEPGKGKPFGLSAILYDGELLSGILPYPVPVNYLFTYFNNSWTKLLGLHLQRNDTQTYFLNPDTDRDIKYVTFTEFTIHSTSSLGNRELWDVLGNVEADNGFNLGILGSSNNSIAKKLVESNTYVIFDLGKTSKKYNSEITNEQVTVTSGGKIANTYPKIQHAPTTEPFYIKGLKSPKGQYIKVKGGFPNEPLDGSVNVYYKSVGNTDPLLIELKLKTLASDIGGYIISKYYISKTANGLEWDIHKVAGVGIGDSDLKAVLEYLSSENKLDIDSLPPTVSGKLKDLTKDLEIDLTRTTEDKVGDTKSYTSNGVNIPYIKEKNQVHGYWVVRHANAFLSFSVKSIKTGSGGNITGNNLPPSGTLLGGLYAYYADSSYNKLVLIELIGFHNPDLSGYPIYVYYYYKYKGPKWEGYILSTTVNNNASDISKVITHVKENGGKINLKKLGDRGLTNKLTKYRPDDTGLKEEVDNEDSDESLHSPQSGSKPSSGLSGGEIAGISIASIGELRKHGNNSLPICAQETTKVDQEALQVRSEGEKPEDLGQIQQRAEELRSGVESGQKLESGKDGATGARSSAAIPDGPQEQGAGDSVGNAAGGDSLSSGGEEGPGKDGSSGIDDATEGPEGDTNSLSEHKAAGDTPSPKSSPETTTPIITALTTTTTTTPAHSTVPPDTPQTAKFFGIPVASAAGIGSIFGTSSDIPFGPLSPVRDPSTTTTTIYLLFNE